MIGKQPDLVAYQIFDQLSLTTLEPGHSTGTPVIDDTLEGLANKLGINVRKFLKTIRKFNVAVPSSQEWDPFHKDGRSTGDKLEIPKTNWAQTVETIRGICGDMG